MNRKYIDFVPTSKVSNTPKKPAAPRGRVVREVREEGVMVTMPDSGNTVRTRVFKSTAVRERRLPEPELELEQMEYMPESDYSSDDFSINNSLKLGVVEDYNPKFVNKDVPKRPLYNDAPKYVSVSESAAMYQDQADLANIKAQKVKSGPLGRRKKVGIQPIENNVPVQSQVGTPRTRNVGATYTPPRSPFINQEKVVKRPLSSKNVYQKDVAASNEESKGPVTIITKPEKDSKVGLLVTIILTIILGAAAGTVAFLLLPK